MNDRQFELVMEQLRMLTTPTVTIQDIQMQPSIDREYRTLRGQNASLIRNLNGKDTIIKDQASIIRNLRREVAALKKVQRTLDNFADKRRSLIIRQGDRIEELSSQVRVLETRAAIHRDYPEYPGTTIHCGCGRKWVLG